MGSFAAILTLATFLCSLVAGFLFAFALVVMPGMRNLPDGEFLRAFQVVDRVIQHNQPIFLLVWIGSIATLVASGVLGFPHLDVTGRLLIIFALVVYLLGVQLPTFAIHIPLNNKLQALNVDAMDEASRRTAREDFEPRWNRWNAVRTALASLTSLLSMTLLVRL